MPAKNRTVPLAAAAILLAGGAGAGGGIAAYSALSSNDNGTTTTVVNDASGSQGSDAQPAASTDTLSVGDVYKRAYKGVVEITVTTSSSGSGPFGDSGQEQQALGSGFVYDDQGDIVTNNHVVDGATSVSVKFWNGATYSAKVVGTDPSTDLAVVRVDAPQDVLVPLELGDSGSLQVGDGVVAIGSPFGLDETVTSGIVSALNREIDSPNGFGINNAIQTDAAINHGNSGGPLLNLQGEVIGVNAQIESDGGGSDGVGFAIPSSTVQSVASKLASGETVEHAYLGVSVQTIPADVASQLGTVAGAEIAQIRQDTPAAQAGLKGATGQKTVDGQPYPTGGDVITKVDDRTITSGDELQNAIDAHSPGDTVTITYVRDGQQQTVDVKLANRPS
ncbi:MAG TPA: trypsin-like peptidase domain-containing protein [Gaiellaceae bacterium]